MAFGAIDLRSGSSSLTGANLWDLDKSPLNQLNGGVEDVIGKQAGGVGNTITSLSQWLTNSILGLEKDAQTSFTHLDTYFTNIERFLGGLDPLSPSFSLETAAEDFINLILNPTGLLSTTEQINNFVDALWTGLGGIGTATETGLQTLMADLKSVADQVTANFETMVDQWIVFLGGTSTGNITTDLNNLYSQWDNIPLIGPLVEALTGTTPSGTPSSSDWLNQLEGYGTLGSNSGLNANNLFNQVSSELLGMLNVSHIGHTPSNPNLVSDPNFTAISSVSGGLFTQDSTQSYAGTAGAAKVIADGTGPKTLLSNLIGVSPQQSLSVSAQAQWSALAVSGAATTTLYVVNRTGNTAAKLSGSTQSALGSGLNSPYAITTDPSGNIFIADLGNNRIVKITPTGTQTTLPFTGLNVPAGVAVDAAGNVYVADYTNNRIAKLTPGGVQSTVFTGLTNPNGVMVDIATGDVYAADYGNHRIEKLSGGVQTTVGFTGLNGPTAIALDSAGHLYVADYANNRIVKLAGGVQTTLPFTGLSQPVDVVVDASGNVYVADSGNNRVVMLAGSTQTVVGFTGLSAPSGIALFTSGGGSSSPFVLGLNYYSDVDGVTLLSQPQIQALAATPATTTWQQLSGTSVVPAGAYSVRLRLDLLPSATSGTGWFTAATLSKTGLLQAIWMQLSDGTIVDHVMSDIQALISTIQTDIGNLLPQSDFTSLIAALGGGTEVTDVVNWVDELLTGQSTLNGAKLAPGSVPTTAVPDLGTLFNNIVNEVLGQIGSAFGLSDVVNAFTHQSDVITGQAATITTLSQQVSALQASLAGTTLRTASDNFLRVNNLTLGPNWYQAYTTASQGIYATPSGNCASWASTTVGVQNTVLCQWIGPNQHSATDDQEVTIVLSSQGQNPFLGTSSYVDVLGRMSDDRKNFIRLRFGGDGSVYVSRVINNAETPMLTYPPGHFSPSPGIGASLTLLTGLPGLPRAFQGFLNGNLVISTNDTVSLYGTSYRGWGFGAVAGVNPLYIGQSLPPNVSQWTATG